LVETHPNIEFEWNNTQPLNKPYYKTYNFGGISNLSIVNPENTKCSIMSFADFNEPIIQRGHDWEPFNVVQIYAGLRWGNSCLTKEEIQSTYGIEYIPFQYPIAYADFDAFLEQYRTEYDPTQKIRKAMFAGASYDNRKNILDCLSTHPLIDIHDSMDRHQYYHLMKEYAVALSLNGNGEWCVRDFEAMGLGIPVLRSQAKTNFYNPITHDVHYIRGSDPSPEAWFIYSGYTPKQIADQFIDKLITVIHDDEYLKSISINGLMYYEMFGKNDKIVKLFLDTFNPLVLL
jgi:hypothetical protein